MADQEGVVDFMPKAENLYPSYIRDELFPYEQEKIHGYLRCLDCPGEFSLDQADSYMCRKVHQTVSRLANKGWRDEDILRECKRIYGNEVLIRHYGFNPPILVRFT